MIYLTPNLKSFELKVSNELGKRYKRDALVSEIDNKGDNYNATVQKANEILGLKEKLGKMWNI